MRTSARAVYRAEKDIPSLLRNILPIRDLADGEKEALGFLPEVAYREAILHSRLIAMMAQRRGQTEVVGFVLFSGVYPNARIQQVVVAADHRRAGVASALLNEVISELEIRGYLSVSAAVASDLPVAQAFYERNGFIARRSRAGGTARSRTIVLRSRDLDTASLFSLLDAAAETGPSVVDLGLRQRSAGNAPLYVIDLNVLFDLVKNRSRTGLANQLFGAALAHQIRLAIAPEFLVELERTTTGVDTDPILKLARRLPRLPETDRAETDRLSALVEKLVFDQAKTKTDQSVSDVKHIAQAALARASGYVTSDGTLLKGREKLLENVGIDLASLDEFAALLPTGDAARAAVHLKGNGFEVKPITTERLRRYLTDMRVTATTIADFVPSGIAAARWSARAVYEGHDVVGIGIRISPDNIDAPARIMVHVRPDHVACETFADHLIDAECNAACEKGPMTIELPNISGQGAVRRAATLRGFIPVRNNETLIKVALGRPVTADNWTMISRQTQRRTGLHLPDAPPDAKAIQSGVKIRGPDRKWLSVRLTALEDALSPSILVWPGRNGVIVPITKGYADDLLGTGAQMPLFGSPEAAFHAQRTYFNTPRAAAVVRPGMPILFYESKRSGGRGSIVAVARVVDVTVVAKTLVADELLRRGVVEDLEPLSISGDVLATTFDNLLRFPAPVGLNALRDLGAVGTANLQTTTPVEEAILGAILEQGWPRD